MLSECDFKNELCDVNNRYYKFLSRDIEIKRACHNCRIDIDKRYCVLSNIYGQRFHVIELNKLLKDINDRKIEISLLQECINEIKLQKEHGKQDITNLDKEIKILEDRAAKIRANDFLRSTTGRENYLSYTNSGYFDIKGTNNSVYRITNKGVISKIWIQTDFVNRIKNFVVGIFMIYCYPKRKKEILVGKIQYTDYPLEDAIAIVYVNIVKDSDRFDEDKACGRISVHSR